MPWQEFAPATCGYHVDDWSKLQPWHYLSLVAVELPWQQFVPATSGYHVDD